MTFNGFCAWSVKIMRFFMRFFVISKICCTSDFVENRLHLRKTQIYFDRLSDFVTTLQRKSELFFEFAVPKFGFSFDFALSLSPVSPLRGEQ